MGKARQVIEETFKTVFGGDAEATARAPGRVNLIGEHTDYNDGFVLPVAIDRTVEFAGRRIPGRTVRVYSRDFDGRTEFSLDKIEKDAQAPWSNYLRGVSKFLEESGCELCGAEIAFGGDVPREAGLSSSAAVELGTIAFWKRLVGFDLDPVAAVMLAKKAENDFVGVPSGIMDQFISALGKKDHALFLDCRNLSYRQVPLPADFNVVVCNSGVKRALAQSEYEVRVRQCRQAVAQIGGVGLAVKSLRDVDLAELEIARDSLNLTLLRRARHIISENARVLEAVKALDRRDIDRFGELMNESHESLRDDYEVSSKELDALVEIARRQPGVLGARMTGAGFGGCTVNLVRADAAGAFVENVARQYREKMGIQPEIYSCKASDGAFAQS